MSFNQKPYFVAHFKETDHKFSHLFVLNIQDFQLKLYLGWPYIIKIQIV